jgi:hypothetical protein
VHTQTQDDINLQVQAKEEERHGTGRQRGIMFKRLKASRSLGSSGKPFLRQEQERFWKFE